MTQSKSKRWIAIGLQKGKFQTTSNIQSPSKKKEFTNKVQERSNFKQDFFQQQYSPQLKLQSFYIDDEVIEPLQLNLSSKKSNKNLIKISHISQKSQFFTSLKSKQNESFHINNQKDNQIYCQKEQVNDEDNLSKSIVLESIDICKQSQHQNNNNNQEYQYNQQTSQVLESVSFSPQIQIVQQIRQKSKTQFQNQKQVFSYDKCPSIKISRPNQSQQSNLKLILDLTQRLKSQNKQLKQISKALKATSSNIFNILQPQIFDYLKSQNDKLKNNFLLQKSQYQLKQAKQIEIIMKKLQSSQLKIDLLQKTIQKKENQIALKQNVLLTKLQLINDLQQQLNCYKQGELLKKQQIVNQKQTEIEKPTQKQALAKQRQTQSILRQKQIQFLQLNRKYEVLKQNHSMLELQKENLQEKLFDLQQKIVGVEMQVEEKVKMQTHILIQKLQQQFNRQSMKIETLKSQNQIDKQIKESSQTLLIHKTKDLLMSKQLYQKVQELNKKCQQYEVQLKFHQNDKQMQFSKQKKQQNQRQIQTQLLKNKRIQLQKLESDLKTKQKKLCELEQKLNFDLIKLQKQKLSIQKKQMDLTKSQNGLSRKAIEIKQKQEQLIQMQAVLEDQLNKNQIKSRQLQQQQYEMSIKLQQQHQSLNNVRQSPRNNHYAQNNSNLHIPLVHQQYPLNYSNPYVIPSSPYVEGYRNQNYNKQAHHQMIPYNNQNKPIYKNDSSKYHYPDTNKLQSRIQRQKNQIYKNRNEKKIAIQDYQFEPTYERQINSGFKLHYQRNYDNEPIFRQNLSSNQFHNANKGIYNSNKPKTSSMKFKPQGNISAFQQTSSEIRLYQSSTNQSLAYQDYLEKQNAKYNNIFSKTKSPLKNLYQQTKFEKSRVEGTKKQLNKQIKKFESTKIYQMPSKDLTTGLYSSVNGQNNNLKSINEGNQKEDQKTSTSKQIRNGVIDINLKLQQLKQQIRKQVNSLK